MKAAPVLALVAAFAVALLAGCGSSGSGDGTETEGSNPAASPPAETSTAPAGSLATPCGNSPTDGPLRATGVSCAKARAIVNEWADTPRCAPPADASRFSCAVAGYRCLGAATGRGAAVTCAAPQRSISFIAKPD